jgi:hypothetical protein
MISERLHDLRAARGHSALLLAVKSVKPWGIK